MNYNSETLVKNLKRIDDKPEVLQQYERLKSMEFKNMLSSRNQIRILANVDCGLKVSI